MQHSSTAVNTATNSTGPSESADDDLPSVMTCANYLKLPPYSTKVLFYVHMLIMSLLLDFIFSLFIIDTLCTGNHVQETTLCNQWRAGIFWFIMMFGSNWWTCVYYRKNNEGRLSLPLIILMLKVACCCSK